MPLEAPPLRKEFVERRPGELAQPPPQGQKVPSRAAVRLPKEHGQGERQLHFQRPPKLARPLLPGLVLQRARPAVTLAVQRPQRVGRQPGVHWRLACPEETRELVPPFDAGRVRPDVRAPRVAGARVRVEPLQARAWLLQALWQPPLLQRPVLALQAVPERMEQLPGLTPKDHWHATQVVLLQARWRVVERAGGTAQWQLWVPMRLRLEREE